MKEKQVIIRENKMYQRHKRKINAHYALSCIDGLSLRIYIFILLDQFNLLVLYIGVL